MVKYSPTLREAFAGRRDFVKASRGRCKAFEMFLLSYTAYAKPSWRFRVAFVACFVRNRTFTKNEACQETVERQAPKTSTRRSPYTCLT